MMDNKVTMSREDAKDKMEDYYVQSIIEDLKEGDTIVLRAFITGDGMTPIDTWSDEVLKTEWHEVFDGEILVIKD